MTQPSNEYQAQRALIEALKDGPLRYNELWKRVRKHIGSLHTFQKYLEKLEKHRIIEKRTDPDDSRAVLISLIPDVAREHLQLLDAINELEQIAKQVLSRYDEKTYHIQLGRIVNLVRVSHSIYSRLHKNKIPRDVYIRVEDEGPSVHILSKGRLSELLEKERKLEALSTSLSV